MFTGLSAFPLTPVTTRGVDEKGFSHILSRLQTLGLILWASWGQPEATPI